MSTNPVVPNAEVTPTTESTPDVTVPTNPAIALWLEVAGAATTKGSAVRSLVVDELTGQEIVKRKDAVLILLTKYEDKNKELKKAEKALAKVEFDAEGKEIRRYYDAEGTKTLKSLRDEIDNINQALINFFNKSDTKKLYELANLANKK